MQIGLRLAEDADAAGGWSVSIWSLPVEDIVYGGKRSENLQKEVRTTTRDDAVNAKQNHLVAFVVVYRVENDSLFVRWNRSLLWNYTAQL